jgi:hypothetical protein
LNLPSVRLPTTPTELPVTVTLPVAFEPVMDSFSVPPDRRPGRCPCSSRSGSGSRPAGRMGRGCRFRRQKSRPKGFHVCRRHQRCRKTGFRHVLLAVLNDATLLFRARERAAMSAAWPPPCARGFAPERRVPGPAESSLGSPIPWTCDAAEVVEVAPADCVSLSKAPGSQRQFRRRQETGRVSTRQVIGRPIRMPIPMVAYQTTLCGS